MRIALVPHTRDWSYDFTAQALARHLADRFEVSIFYGDTLDQIDYRSLDLIVDFWWRGGLHRRFGQRVVKQVSTHRWAQERYGSLSAAQMIHDYLRTSGGVVVPSQRLASELASAPHVTIGPKGFHPETFGDEQQRRGDLVVGWAGNATAIDKRLDVLRAACPDLRVARDLPYDRMPGFYNSIDVITCASDAEGDPRPLIEGMACGCFPVTVDVGIAPELVIAGDRPIVERACGMTVYPRGIVVDRTPEAFAAAFAVCRDNLDQIRAAGRRNAEEMLATRTWKHCAVAWGDAFAAAIERAPEWRVSAREERKARIHAARKKRARLRAEESP